MRSLPVVVERDGRGNRRCSRASSRVRWYTRWTSLFFIHLKKTSLLRGERPIGKHLRDVARGILHTSIGMHDRPARVRGRDLGPHARRDSIERDSLYR
jgi:hypothetical protein